MKSILRSILLLSLLVSTAHAASGDVEKLAGAVPVELSEAVSGGLWKNNGATGYYRAMVITPGPGGQTNVVVQLLSVEKPEAAPKLTKTVVIKEIADQKISSAFLAMDSDKDNEMTLIVTAYGSGTDQDTAMQFKFDGAGNYQVQQVAPEEAPAERDPAVKN
jgi:hypothetical protein